MTKETGGTAFPVPDGPVFDSQPGMTLRDWFAGQFLNGYMASTSTMKNPPDADRVVSHAYMYADAMLKARSE